MKYEKGTFVVVPSRGTLYGLRPIVQTLYMWLCAYANESGGSFPSRRTLADCCGCSVRTIDDALAKLEFCELITKETRISENQKLTNIYHVLVRAGSQPVDDVKYAPPSAKSAPGVVQNLPIELNPVLTQYSTGLPVGITLEEDTKKEKKSIAKYPHALEVFSWFPSRQKSWESMKNIQEREFAEFLWERGESVVRSALKFVSNRKDDIYCPTVNKPSDLERKWADLQSYARRS